CSRTIAQPTQRRRCQYVKLRYSRHSSSLADISSSTEGFMRRSISYSETAAIAGLLLLVATGGTTAAQEFAGREKLRAHSAEFRREVIRVTNGVWVAVGFSNANSVLIDGEGGSIVVDTTSDAEDAKEVKAEFAKLSTAPVRAIIYTHSHPDHT